MRTTPDLPLGPFLELLLEQTRDHALVLLDPAGIVIGWLAGSEHMFGYAPDEILGRPVHVLFTPEDNARGAADHELEVGRLSNRAEDDRWLVRKDGTRLWASGVSTPVRGPDGSLLGFGKVIRDRTDLRAQVETLENRVEALSRAGNHKDVFLSTLAHELRNPLSAMTTGMELLRARSPEVGAVDRTLQLLQRQVDSVQRLVDDLLDVGRIGAGKMELVTKAVDLRDVLHQAVETCRAAAEKRQVELHEIVIHTPIPVAGDQQRLQQVFINLLDNAIKYTTAGRQVWLEATIDAQEVVVRVEDTGIGIDPAVLPEIFELFTQDEWARRMAGGGLGLGLSLVRDLVRLHGGTVQVRSEGRDKGSVFTVRLPLCADEGALPC